MPQTFSFDSEEPGVAYAARLLKHILGHKDLDVGGSRGIADPCTSASLRDAQIKWCCFFECFEHSAFGGGLRGSCSHYPLPQWPPGQERLKAQMATAMARGQSPVMHTLQGLSRTSTEIPEFKPALFTNTIRRLLVQGSNISCPVRMLRALPYPKTNANSTL